MSSAEQLQKEDVVLVVGWKNEDELPDYITDELYNIMFPMSKVDIVRLFPFVNIDGKEHFLGTI